MKYILLLILLILIILYIYSGCNYKHERENFLDEKDINSNVRYTNYLLRGAVDNKVAIFPK